MSMEKKFKHFLIKESEHMIQIQFQFSSVTPEIEQEINGFLTTLYFGLRTNISLDLGEVKYLDLKTMTYLLGLGRELSLNKRKLIITNPPLSLERFFTALEINKFVSL